MTDNRRNEFRNEIFNLIDIFDYVKILEIGTSHGNLSSFFINMLGESQSFLHCINPTGGIYVNFISKLRSYNNKHKVRFFKITTEKFFELYRFPLCRTYNLIYVNVNEYDTPSSALLSDLQNAFCLLKEDGILWINKLDHTDVQTYFKMYLGQYEIVHIGEELGLKKIYH